jgi:hypothetical protein
MPAVVSKFPLHDPMGVQAGYSLSVQDENGDAVSGAEFGGLNGTYNWILPPQSVQIRRSIRADVMKDLGAGISVISGGEGIGRIQVQGTYGVGPQLDPTYPTLGRNARDAMVQFFQAFMDANDERGKVGKPALSMLFEMVGGRWSEPDFESYYVWPETLPADSRSAGRPHSWEWSASLLLLAPYQISGPFDFSTIPNPSDLLKKATGLAALCQKLQGIYKSFQTVVSKLKLLQAQLNQIVARIKGFIAGVKNAIYDVTDLIRGTAQILQDLKKSLNFQDFKSDITQAISGMIYDTRVFLGQTGMTVYSFQMSGSTSSSFTPGRTVSPSRPTAVGISAGDTLASISNHHLGSSSRWTDLVNVNNLEFPYLDFSGPNGTPDASYVGMRVLGAGSILKLPLPIPTGTVALAVDPIGTDLPDAPDAANVLQGGTVNLAASAIRRLITPQGRIPWHPLYGSRLKKRIGTAQTLASVVSCQKEVIATLKFDKRILNVGIVGVSLPPGGIVISTNLVSPLGVVPISTSVAG